MDRSRVGLEEVRKAKVREDQAIVKRVNKSKA